MTNPPNEPKTDVESPKADAGTVKAAADSETTGIQSDEERVPQDHAGKLNDGAGQDKLSPDASDDFQTELRLHVATLWLPALDMIVRVIIPSLIATFFIPLGTVIFFVVCCGLLPTALYYVLSFFTFRYTANRDELILKSGVVFRRERRIPLDRVQELKINQGIIHRVLGLAKVEVITAGGDLQEAHLNVLTLQAAQEIKKTIGRNQRGVDATTEVEELGETLDFDCQLGLRNLLLGGLTSKIVASLGAVVAAIAYSQVFIRMGQSWWGKAEQEVNERVELQWLEKIGLGRLTDRLESKLPDFWLFDFVIDLFFNDTLSKSLGLVLLGLAGSVVAYVIRYHGFRLSRNGDVLTTSYGLLSLRNGSLVRDRIQTLKLEEGLLRRWFKLASIRADSAGDRKEVSEAKNRDVLVPVASKDMAQKIAQQAMPGLPTLEPKWQRVSRLAIMRGSKKGWLLVLSIMLLTFRMFGWYTLMLLPAIPLIYVLNYQWFRNTGYWLDNDYFLSRTGWLNRSTVCLPVKNIQNVSVSQTLFDRRLRLATLSIDTAGQSNTGGGPIIRHLPVEAAKKIQLSLANLAAEHEFS